MFETLINNISKTVVGNVDKIKLTLAAIISEGSILIEDNPGSGKTTLAKTITLNLHWMKKRKKNGGENRNYYFPITITINDGSFKKNETYTRENSRWCDD